MAVCIDPSSPLPPAVQLANSQVEIAVVDALIRHDKLPLVGIDYGIVYFPLWYPALVFALACVAALRLGRRFTLRSAIIATTVVAGLLGITAAL